MLKSQNFWQQTNGLPSGAVSSLAINSSGHVFAGTYGNGVYRSTDNGNNWTQINTGLTNNYVRSLAINSSGYIFAGTSSGGVFKSINSTTGIEESESLLSEFQLYQNYPNPFNPVTTINYQIAKGEKVTLKVYDILGNEVSTLVEEYKEKEDTQQRLMEASYQAEYICTHYKQQAIQKPTRWCC